MHFKLKLCPQIKFQAERLHCETHQIFQLEAVPILYEV